jgi:hypothetical protein
MNLVRTIFAELLGLFVDDWVFALLLLLWVGLFATPLRLPLGRLAGPALFLGLAGLTLVFVLRQARYSISEETNSGAW